MNKLMKAASPRTRSEKSKSATHAGKSIGHAERHTKAGNFGTALSHYEKAVGHYQKAGNLSSALSTSVTIENLRKRVDDLKYRTLKNRQDR